MSTESVGSRRELVVANCVHTADATQLDSFVASAVCIGHWVLFAFIVDLVFLCFLFFWLTVPVQVQLIVWKDSFHSLHRSIQRLAYYMSSGTYVKLYYLAITACFHCRRNAINVKLSLNQWVLSIQTPPSILPCRNGHSTFHSMPQPSLRLAIKC